MKVTRTFNETLKAYNDKYRLIVNRGGTRSGKSFATLQLLFLIALNSVKPRIITCVSHSFPHLEMGIVRDFNNILLDSNINPEAVSTKRPYIYKLGNSIVEFISVDNIGKALGAARDILFVNECNRIKHTIYHQLMVRTKETIFLDFNPDGPFWLQDHEYLNDVDSIEIVSTYLDNIKNITQAQIQELEKARLKAEKEKKAGKAGYWSFWWQVYGLGQFGKLIDRLVFPNYSIEKEITKDWILKGYGLDFGFSNDPSALVAVYLRGESDILLQELVYSTGLINTKNDNLLNSSIEEIARPLVENDKFIVADSAEPKSITELRGVGFNMYAVRKPKIKDSIRNVLEYNLFVHADSKNIIKELDGYVYPVDKDDNIIAGEPIGANHALDAIRYFIWMKNRIWK